MRKLCVMCCALVVAAFAFSMLVKAQAPPNEPKSTPAMKETGEPEGDAFHFPPMPVDQRVYQMNDPMISNLARKIENGSANLIERRAWWWMEQRLAPFDKPIPDNWRIEAQAVIRAMEMSRGERGGPVPEATSYTWTPIGPMQYPDYYNDNVSGRATALWVDPASSNTIIMGTADGGVWKTTNGGTNWTSLFDAAASLSIGSLAVDPNNKQVIYVGTGEGNFCLDSIGAAGIYKSTNGGSTWSLLTVPFLYTDGAHRNIRRIAVDPRDSTGAKLYAVGDGGLYYSTNTGTSWTRTVCGASGTNDYGTDLVLDSVNGTGTTSIVYVAFGYVWGNADNGIYRSTGGGGGAWTKIAPAAPFPSANLGRITLVSAPSDPKQLYALTENYSTYGSLGIFYTVDATAATVTWQAKNSSTAYCSTQCWYDMTGVVDPTNPAHLIVGGLDVYQSTDNGATLTQVSQWWNTGSVFSHADHHHMVMPSSTTLYNANDGGFFIGTINWSTPASTTWVNKNTGLNTLQFYSFCQHPTDATKIHGGLQDNGDFYFNGSTWFEVEGGDGGASAWDQSNALYAYEEYVYAGIERNSNMVGSPSSWTCIQNINGCSGCDGSCIPDGSTAFIAPFVLDANNQNTMYTGTYRLWSNTAPRTGSTWTAISPTLTGSTSNYVTAIHSAKNNGTAGTIYAGTSNGKAQVTINGGTNWTDVSTGLPSGYWITSFTTDPTNGLHVLVTVSGYGTPHIYRSLTGSTSGSWTNITGTLPAVPFNTIILDPADANHAYAGSDFGVYENTAVWTGTTWTSITSNLPAVSVQQLGYVSGGKLRAATHGRSVWELIKSTLSTPKEDSPSKDMKAAKATGTQISVTFTNGCGALDNTVYTGSLATLQSSGVSWTGRYCNKGVTSPLTFDPGTTTNIYFVLVGNNTDGIEGSYGQATGSVERPAAGAGSPCSYTQNLTGVCP